MKENRNAKFRKKNGKERVQKVIIQSTFMNKRGTKAHDKKYEKKRVPWI